MNSHIFSFVECGHRVSKHVDDRWDNTGIQYNPDAVIGEDYNKIYCTKLKIQMLQKMYNNDVVILIKI